MRIASVQPVITSEAPVGDEDRRARLIADELHLRVARAETTTSSPGSGPLDQETRDGLKRLSELLQKKKRPSREPSEDRKRRRALGLYKDIQSMHDPLEGCGLNIDLLG